MTEEEVLQELHEEFINSEEYQIFLWEINNVNPLSLEN